LWSFIIILDFIYIQIPKFLKTSTLFDTIQKSKHLYGIGYYIYYTWVDIKLKNFSISEKTIVAQFHLIES
jgi:hypothetical protein